MERSFHITHLVFGDIEDKVDVLRGRGHRQTSRSAPSRRAPTDGLGLAQRTAGGAMHLFRPRWPTKDGGLVGLARNNQILIVVQSVS